MNSALAWWGLIFLVVLAPGGSHGSNSRVFAAGRFSDMIPGTEVSGWEPMIFHKIKAHTRYSLEKDDGRTVLRADSRASASGLARRLAISPKDYPVITWKWKVSNTVAGADVTLKKGDDYAARIYITFAEDPKRLSFFQKAKIRAIEILYGKTPPSAALAYVWGTRAEVGSIHPNPYTDRVQMFIVESGPAHLNLWRSVRRNIVDDYQLAFGTDPPKISSIAVMTDTDNTGESATAWYGDIIFHRQPAD